MLSGKRRCNYIKFVKADNAVDILRTRKIGDRANIIDRQSVIFYRSDIVDRGPRPRLVKQLFAGHQSHMPAALMSFLKKLIPFVLAGNADDVVFHPRFYFVSKEWHNLAVKTKKQLREPRP